MDLNKKQDLPMNLQPHSPTPDDRPLENLSATNFSNDQHTEAEPTESAFSRLDYVTQLNTFLQDPSYRVVFFARHAHAEQEGKKVEGKDKFRKLDARGIADAAALGQTLSVLTFDKVVMLTSSATRTHDTARAIEREMNAAGVTIVADDAFYHVPVKRYFKYLRECEEHQDTRHAFIVGHNSAMTKVFLKLSGGNAAFIPTAGVMALAVKSDSWNHLYTRDHTDVHVFTWSPKGTEMLESASSLESMSLPLPAFDIRATQARNICLFEEDEDDF